MAKRLFDVVCAGLGALLCAPVLGLVALLVKLDSPGPVLFWQERVGRHGRSFRICKFRSMRAGPGTEVTADNDDRITRMGRFLRASKLDELPQLLNVLRGDMSLVGPRPEVRRYAAHWPAEARERILAVRPGITDPASIRYRNESAELASAEDPEAHYLTVVLPRKVQLYLSYVDNRSFAGDLRILWRTARAVVAPARPVSAALATSEAGRRCG